MSKKCSLSEFADNHDVDYSARPAKKTDIRDAEELLGVRFGPQLTDYLLTYGYLGYGMVEFLGIDGVLGLKSDLVSNTQMLHNTFPETTPYIAIQDEGEIFAVADTRDNVIIFVPTENRFIKTRKKLNDYILHAFWAEEANA